jgi:superfamily II DNA or RNA helicase
MSYGTNSYSHVEFEKSLMNNKECLHNYMLLIDDMVKQGYLDDYQKGDKLVIFAATIKMCDRILHYMKSKYGKTFDIRRYVEDDPYENAIDADIRITTVQSCGTAIDIPKLRVAILTTSIQSPVSNLQALGRLRKLPDRDVKFYYCYCEDIPKHKDYHLKKMELFDDRSASIKELKSNIMI